MSEGFLTQTLVLCITCFKLQACAMSDFFGLFVLLTRNGIFYH